MKKTLATLAIAGMLALTGCDMGAEDEITEDKTNLRVHVIQLPNGRDVTCVRSYGTGGGVTCDWDGAK